MTGITAPIESKTSRVLTVLSCQDQGCCVELWQDRVLATVERQYNTPEHRTRPVELLRAMTSRSRYTRTRSAKESHLVSRKMIYCNGTSKIGTEIMYYWDLAEYFTGSIPDPDWGLAFRLKLDDDRVNLAESIGEWKESVGLLHSAVMLMRDSIRTAKDWLRSRRKRRELLKWFRRTFGRDPHSRLELQDAVTVDLLIKFGIVPTADLLYTSVEQLRRSRPALRRIQVTVTAKGQTKTAGLYGGAQLVDTTVSMRAIGYVRYTKLRGDFTGGNLAEQLWAGIGLSFVIDWFIDVSSYLHSFSVMDGVEVLGISVIRRFVSETRDDRVQMRGQVVTKRGFARNFTQTRYTTSTVPFAIKPQTRLSEDGAWGKLLTCVELLYMFRRR